MMDLQLGWRSVFLMQGRVYSHFKLKSRMHEKGDMKSVL